MTPVPHPGRNRLAWTGLVAATLAVATVLALLVTGRLSGDGPSAAAPPSTPLAARATSIDAASFLDTYVQDGRVVRADQGGDTVSEGQAYGLLIALGAEDRQRFEEIWRWTDTHLRRDDGLLSWRWDGEKVADPSSAADADLDVARALVLAGDRFDDPTLTRAGVDLGTAVLDHETVPFADGRVLVAGQWATTAPYSFNPSYVSPAATRVLRRASGDGRWDQVEAGSRAAVRALTQGGQLPPDWAEIDDEGAVRPVPGPGGQPVQYGYDAARTLVRHAESCEPADRRLAATSADLVAATSSGDTDGGGTAVARYDLAGSPQTRDTSPLTTIAQAAGASARGQEDVAVAEIRAAGRQQRKTPTYYGDAWTVLGPMLLTDQDLGGCPPLADS